MPTIFTMLMNGQLPAAIVYQDERSVAFLSKDPVSQGHTLVVPREEVDYWLDADDDLMAHLHRVSKKIAAAQHRAFDCARVATMVIGLEVPHLHIHLVPINELADVNFGRARRDVPMAELQTVAAAIREALDPA